MAVERARAERAAPASSSSAGEFLPRPAPATEPEPELNLAPAAQAPTRGVDLLASVAIALLALGAASVLFGHWGWGIASIGAGLFSASESRTFRRRLDRSALFGFVGVVFLLGVASRWVEPSRRVARAERELAWLAAELSAHARNAGAAPETLAELRWRTVERFGPVQPLDPWGQPYAYAPGKLTGSFELSSHGPDRIPSEDDVRHTAARPQPR